MVMMKLEWVEPFQLDEKFVKRPAVLVGRVGN
jgi:hypothetical protein